MRYELIPTKNKKAFQMKALVDMPEYGVQAGDLGGTIRIEDNVPQEGTGWVEQGSTVIGFTRLLKGVVKGKSKVVVRGEISCTSIDNSQLKGSIRIAGDVTIKDSKLEKQVEIKGGVSVIDSTLIGVELLGNGRVQHSKMNNISFSKEFNIQDATLCPTGGYALVAGITEWQGVTIEEVKITVLADTTFKDVKIQLRERKHDFNRFIVRKPTTLKHVTFGDMCKNVTIGDFERETVYPCSIIGDTNLLIQAQEFFIENTSIQGEVSICSGSFTSTDSTLSDFLKIIRNVEIVSCTLSDCAVLDGGTFRNQFAAWTNDKEILKVEGLDLKSDESLVHKTK